MILDGAGVVHLLKPVGLKTFAEYSSEVFSPYISSQIREASRCDIIWHHVLDRQLSIPSPSEWGWEKLPDGAVGWSPKWMLLPAVVHIPSELLKC